MRECHKCCKGFEPRGEETWCASCMERVSNELLAQSTALAQRPRISDMWSPPHRGVSTLQWGMAHGRAAVAVLCQGTDFNWYCVAIEMPSPHGGHVFWSSSDLDEPTAKRAAERAIMALEHLVESSAEPT